MLQVKPAVVSRYTSGMTYRDDGVAAAERVAALERELAQLGAEHAARVEDLRRQLAEARQVLDGLQKRQRPRSGAWILAVVAVVLVLAGIAMALFFGSVRPPSEPPPVKIPST